VALSHDVPADEDELDRRHSGAEGTVLALPRELAHLRTTARRAGYTLEAAEPAPVPGAGIDGTVEALEKAMAEQDVDAYLALLEPVFREHGTARVAAAAVALLRARLPAPSRAAGRPAASSPAGGDTDGEFTRLFVSLGSKDGMRVGDLVGAILGETGIPSDAIGKIDLRETFSRVEIASSHADQVISKMNGTTIRNRSVRVDLDRAERGGGGPRRGGAPRGGGGPRGGGSRGGAPRGPRRPRD
jgi:ATP-dependent RNA helicase DeaD